MKQDGVGRRIVEQVDQVEGLFATAHSCANQSCPSRADLVMQDEALACRSAMVVGLSSSATNLQTSAGLTELIYWPPNDALEEAGSSYLSWLSS